jgi:hypothetical protein
MAPVHFPRLTRRACRSQHVYRCDLSFPISDSQMGIFELKTAMFEFFIHGVAPATATEMRTACDMQNS